MLNSKFWIFAIIALGMMLFPNELLACPTCKEAIAQQDQTNLDAGFALSVVFMLSMPLSIATGWAIFIWRSFVHRKSLALAG